MRIKFVQEYIDKLRGKKQKIAQNVSYTFSQRIYNGQTERVLNIFFYYDEGIANRIKHLFSYMRMYQGLYDTIDIHWPLQNMCNSSFNSLFKFDYFKRVNELNHTIFLDNTIWEGTWRLFVKPEELDMNFAKAFPVDVQNPCIDFEYQRIPQYIKDIYLPYFNALKPSFQVQQLIDTIHIPQNCVGIHIRHNKNWKEWNRWADNDLDLFIEKMNNYPKDTIFLLSCCDKEVHDFVHNHFPNRIIELHKEDIENSNNLQDMAELYLLSKTKEIIGTYGSTFTEVAWWLGGCKCNVDIVGSYNKWKNNGMPQVRATIEYD